MAKKTNTQKRIDKATKVTGLTQTNSPGNVRLVAKRKRGVDGRNYAVVGASQAGNREQKRNDLRAAFGVRG